jgi:hypothetical protein
VLGARAPAGARGDLYVTFRVFEFRVLAISQRLFPKSPFRKEYKPELISKTSPLERSKCFWKIVLKEVLEKQKPFYKSFDFTNWKSI